MGTQIHPTAVVESGAELGDGVRVGPFCHVGGDVVLGDRVELFGHVSVAGATTVGADTRIHAHAALGGPPQNVRHRGGATRLVLGRNCTIREAATINLGSDNSRGETRIGDNLYMMAYAHIAHDCVVGDNVTMANNATLGGHVELGDNVNLGGLCAVHQFVRIGHHAFVAGCAAVVGDVIPFGMAVGNRARLRGLNVVGLRRAGVSRSELTTIRAAYRALFLEEGALVANAARLRAQFAGTPVAAGMIDFILAQAKRHFTVPAPGSNGDDEADAGS